MLAILQFLRSARVILPETFGLTRSSIWKKTKRNTEHIHNYWQQMWKSGLKKGFKEEAIALKKLNFSDSWDGQLLALNDFPYCRKIHSWSQFF